MNMRTVVLVGVGALALSSQAVEPIAYWRMDELTGDNKIVDQSGNGRDLTVRGNCALVDSYLSGKALYNPADTAGACASFSCPQLGNRTVSLWVKLESDDGEFGKGDNPYPHLFSNISGMRVLYNYNSTVATDGSLYCGSSAMVSKLGFDHSRGYWSHVAVVISDISAADGGTAICKLYENGLLKSISPVTGIGAVPTAATTGILGNMNLSATRPIHGALDEVKIFDVALSAEEVAAEYERLRPDVFAHWTMDEFDDTSDPVVVKDSIGRHDLTLRAGVSVSEDALLGTHALFVSGIDKASAVATADEDLDSLTFAAWLKVPNDQATTEVLAGNSYPRIFHATDGLFFYMHSETNDYGGLLNCHGQNVELPATALADKGRWTHVALVVDSKRENGQTVSKCKWYTNGRMTMDWTDVSADTEKLTLQGGKTFCLGGNGSNRPFYGSLDDVWIFTRALTDAEVQTVYQGASKVDAGPDVSVAGPSATLCGKRDFSVGQNPFGLGAAGRTRWTLTSAPTGGEGATIEDPLSLSTVVSLPVVGTYEFRLDSIGLGGRTESDTVTVVRTSEKPTSAPDLAVSAEEQSVTMPGYAILTAVSATAERYAWRKVSGPGGVYFEDAAAVRTRAIFTAPGDYVIECVADKGGVAATDSVALAVTGSSCAMPGTEKGLVAWWNFDQGPWESLTKTRCTFNNTDLKLSKSGFAVGPTPTTSGSAANATSVNEIPSSEAVTTAYWSFYDFANLKNASLQNGRQFLNGVFTLQYNVSANNTKEPSFSVTVTYAKGADTWSFSPDASRLRNGSLKDRWAHIAFSFDLSDVSGISESDYVKAGGIGLQRAILYIDGDPIAPSKLTTTATDDNGSVSITRQTSVMKNHKIGGHGTQTDRYFPGLMDDIRYYTQRLTQDEIRRLAFDFTEMNRAPIVELPVASATMTVKDEGEFAVSVFDDGLPTGGALSVKWELVDGDEAKVDFSTTEEHALSLCPRQTGTFAFRVRATDGLSETVSEKFVVTVKPRGLLILFR